MVLHFWRLTDVYRQAQIHDGSHAKRSSMSNEQVDANSLEAGEFRPHVPFGLEIDAGDADEARLHARQVIDDDLHSGIPKDGRARCRPTFPAGNRGLAAGDTSPP